MRGSTITSLPTMDELDLTSYTVDDLLALWDSAGSKDEISEHNPLSFMMRAIGLEIGRRAALAHGVQSPRDITAITVFFGVNAAGVSTARYGLSNHMLKYARSLEEKRI